jgi:hypothetical protein
MKTTHERFKDWCKETNRSGGVLVGSSIKEFCEWLDKEKEAAKKIDSTELLNAINSGRGSSWVWNGEYEEEIECFDEDTALYNVLEVIKKADT